MKYTIEKLNNKYGEYGSLSNKYNEDLLYSNNDMLADGIDQLTYYNTRQSIFGLTVIKAPMLLNAAGVACCGLAKLENNEY